MQARSSVRLRLVPRRQRIRLEPNVFRNATAPVQGSLFPAPGPGVAVFVRVPEVEGIEFERTVRLACPACIVDLRLAPRFDLGHINRQTAFRLFSDVKAQYVDATCPMMKGMSADAALELVRDLVRSDQLDQARPLMFLLGTETTSAASESQILELLESLGKPATSVVEVPTYG